MKIFRRKPKQRQESEKAIHLQDIRASYKHSVMLAEHKCGKEKIACYDAYQRRMTGVSEAYGKALFNATMTMTGTDYDSFLAKAANVIPILESRLKSEYVDSVTAISEECRKAIKSIGTETDDRLLDELEAEKRGKNESSSA